MPLCVTMLQKASTSEKIEEMHYRRFDQKKTVNYTRRFKIFYKTNESTDYSLPINSKS